jgi:GTP diphosphokinase / guanosine-3',5'-bis(diphosphate) 3'-diphosphatase
MIRFDDILDKVSSSYTEKDITLLKKAYVFAAQAHQGQVRRSGVPYLSHPLEVADMLADMRMDKTTLAAGLLHDVLEDTSVSPTELKKIFGPDITHLVEGVTKISRFQESSPENRQAETIRKIIIAMTDDLRVIFIKLADRIHNLKTLKYLSLDKQKLIALETLEIYAPIANRLGMGRIKAELEDLSFRYVEPDNYFKISDLVEPRRKAAEAELKKISRTMTKVMRKNAIPADIFSRIKRLYSIHNKMNRQDIDFDQVYDFMALRLITDTVKNCYAILGITHQNWPHLPHRFRDFIAMPKPNLYQALHTTIITEEKHMFEIQIRTRDMHNLAENGIAAHWKYKETDPQSIMKDDQRLLWLRDMVDLYREQKSPREFLKALKTDLIPEEVYVFTPDGQVVPLPLGASALDFAFRIHTEIGHAATGAKINGKPAPLHKILKTGNIVEILTDKTSHPSRENLNIVFTSKARHHIKHWLNRQEKKKAVSLGKQLWRKRTEKTAFPAPGLREPVLLRKIAKSVHLKINTMSDFYALIGQGKIVLNAKLLERIFSKEGSSPPQRPPSLIEKVVTRVVKKPSTKILVTDTDGALVRLAKCCSPIKGEPIIGYITRGKGITAHSLRCSLIVSERLNPQRLVDVTWDESAQGFFKASLQINSIDSPGVLAELTAAIAEAGGNITKADVTTTVEGKAQARLSLMIRDAQTLENIISRISKLKNTISVVRV